MYNNKTVLGNELRKGLKSKCRVAVLIVRTCVCVRACACALTPVKHMGVRAQLVGVGSFLPLWFLGLKLVLRLSASIFTCLLSYPSGPGLLF